MRMTIYLLDGCSADYVIIKNNFHPLPCIGAISDGFPDWITGKHTHTLAGPWETQFQVVDVVGWSWGQKGEGPGIW